MEEDLSRSMRHFLERLKEEYGLYCSFFEKVKVEQSKIASLSMADLHQLLLEKEALLNKAEQIEADISQLRVVWKEAQELIEPKLAEEIREFLKTFADMMQALVVAETENEKKLVEQNVKKEEELGMVRKARRLNKSYGLGTDLPPRPNKDIVG